MLKRTFVLFSVFLSIALVGCTNEVECINEKQASSELFASIAKSAEEGNADSQFKLGEIYMQGRNDVPQNHPEAFNCYIKAARQGHKEAQIAVARAYQNGDGVPKNMGEAVNWYQKVAAQTGPSSIEAQLVLAQVYANGNGVPMNRDEAINWYQKAAELGNDKAKQELSRLLSEK